MTTLTIITNGRKRPLYALVQLPIRALADFDYVQQFSAHSPRFVQYRGSWYDVYDSQSVTRELGFDQFKGWHGIVSDTLFSGMLFKLCDNDTVVCGRYFS